ncbi:Bug family tripartite tricarboxylate transporter substrate binding protein [Bradyrhizobium canariense]|uniref:Tripartite-type tricarboxylate transporter, receptor component TctC n=1 Tax=Bradyrhizobium canariense TaxID=255045 RepID=A0A1H1SIB0_9BRAD|nr:tripartite tricarboxylate transporter substrate binding protein [Bradyrhizobium canariense]SDS47089.1 Tripartite-type tricarboxylate transporter, receptor component TctC [Bradyrhizobium canariense]
MKLRSSLLAILLGGLFLAGSSPVMAEDFPTHPITIVVPYAAGGGTDLLMRVLQEPLRQFLGQPIIVENKSGAAGAIAAREVAHAAPDGYTLLVANNGIAVVPLLQTDAGYDFLKDFAALTVVARTPMVVIANGKLPIKTLPDLIEYGKQEKKGLQYGSAGVGSLGHLSAELFASMSGIKLEHLPYRGQNPTMMAVVSGEAPIAFTSSSDAMLGFAKSDKLKILGVGSSEPSPLLPGVPPISTSLPGYSAEVWQGVVAPAGTAAVIIAKLNDAFAKALALPGVQQKFVSLTYSAASTTPAQFSKEIADEYARWSTIIRERNIRVE